MSNPTPLSDDRDLQRSRPMSSCTDTWSLWRADDVAQGFLHDAKQENLGAWKQNLFIARYEKLGLDVVLGLERVEIVRESGNQLHLVVLERTEIENDLPRFLDRQFQLRLCFRARWPDWLWDLLRISCWHSSNLKFTPARLWTRPS